VNGDSLEDVVSCLDQHTLQVRLRVARDPGSTPASGESFFTDPIVLQNDPSFDPPLTFCANHNPTAKVMDLDGDGTSELLARDFATDGWFALRFGMSDSNPSLAWQPVDLKDTDTSAVAQGLLVGDFNGDGLADVAQVSGAHLVYWLNTGNAGFAKRTVDHPAPPDPHYVYRRTAILDYDGDGVDDLVETWKVDSVNNYNVALIANGDFTQVTAYPVDDLKKPIGQDGRFTDGTFNAAVDIDGDGAVDLFGPDGTFYGFPAEMQLLTTITDGVGNTIGVTYDEAGAYTSTCSGSTWPDLCLRHVTGLVTSSLQAAIGPGQERVYHYTYENARMNSAGHGWLGFERTQVREATPEGIVVGEPEPERVTTTVFESPARYDETTGAPLAASDATSRYVYPLAGLPKTVTVEQQVTTGATELEFTAHIRRTRVENTWKVQLSKLGSPFGVLDSRATEAFDPQFFSDPDGPPVWNCAEGFSSNEYGNIRDQTMSCGVSFLGAEFSETVTDFTEDPDTWLISNPELITKTGFTAGYTGQTQVWDPEYDAQGRLYSLTRAPGGLEQHKTVYAPDDFGNPHEITESVTTGEAPRTTTISYDSQNIFPVSITKVSTTNPSQVTQVHFDERWGTPKTIIDPNGVTVQKSYDGLGLLAESQDPAGTTTYTYESEADSMATSAGTVYPRVKVTASRYGTAGTPTGNEVRETDYRGRTVRTQSAGFGGAEVFQEQAFDLRGRLVGVTLPHTSPSDTAPATTYDYDGLDRVVRITDADGQFAQKQYASIVTLASNHSNWLYRDCAGAEVPVCADAEVEVTIDESGVSNVFVKNRIGQVIRNFDGANFYSTARASEYYYDGFHQLETLWQSGRSLSDPFFAYNVLIHDGYGRLLQHYDDDSGDTVNTYNGFDELTTTVDPASRQRTYAYDDLGRLTTIADGQGTTTWTYDQGVNALGRLSSMTSPATGANPAGQQVSYSYEPIASQNRGLLQRADYTIDGRTYSIGYEYDDLGRTSRVHYPDLGGGEPIIAEYRYDFSGVLVGLSQVEPTTTQALWEMTDAFQGYKVKNEDYRNNLVRAVYDYDSQRHWTNSITTTQAPDSSVIQSIVYGHNASGQMTTKNSDAGNLVYNYDNLGRLWLVSEAGQNPSATYQYDDYGNLTQNGSKNVVFRGDHPHLIDTVGQNTYGYDPNGNVDHRIGPDIPGGEQTLTYTPFNLPSQITTGTSTTLFEYTPNEERLVRRDPDSVRYFVSDLYQRQASSSDDSTLEERFRLYAGARLMGEIVRAPGSADKIQFFHTDDLGTVDTISTDHIADAKHQHFDPFGADLDVPTPELTRVGYTGQEHDRDLGLVDMRGRIYDPLAGRFMSQDPMMQAPFTSQGLNPYAYGFNDPINKVDPSGFISWAQVGGAIAGGLVGAGWAVSAGLIGEGFGGAGGLALGLANVAAPAASYGLSSIGTFTPGSGLTPTRSLPLQIPVTGPKDTSQWLAQNAGGYNEGGEGQGATGHDLPAPATLKDVAKETLFVGAAIEAAGPAAARAGVAAAAETGWWARTWAAIKAFFGGGAGAGPRIEPATLREQLTLEEARAGAGERIMEGRINDPRYPEDDWAKMSHVHVGPGGVRTEVHYWENLKTGVREGFKFK
jgi:RHS repeat-associated protein